MIFSWENKKKCVLSHDPFFNQSKSNDVLGTVINVLYWVTSLFRFKNSNTKISRFWLWDEWTGKLIFKWTKFVIESSFTCLEVISNKFTVSIRKIIRKEAHHQTKFQTNDDEEVVSHSQCSQIQTTGKLFVLWLQKKNTLNMCYIISYSFSVHLHFFRRWCTVFH